MANLGLLGALGGLGTGLQTAGQTLFNNEIDKDRELRLEAIRSREYARARADQVADMDRSFGEQKELMKLQSDYRQDEAAFGMDLTLDRDEKLSLQRIKEDGLQRGFVKDQAELDRQFEASNIVNFETDQEGNVFAFTRDGKVRTLSGEDGGALLNNANPLLNYAMDMTQSFNARINSSGLYEDDPAIANLVEARDTALRYVYASLRQGSTQFGLEGLLNLDSSQGTVDQSMVDMGMELFEDSSETERNATGFGSIGGSELNNARERFRTNFPREYAEILKKLGR
tara:strand:- start:1663 stop:2517 length:855 start_codon:yes stop_codon:yes gene_type:complete